MSNTISGQALTSQVSLAGGSLMPEGGPRAIGFSLDFINFQSNIVDFTYAYENTQFKDVMSVFVDNSENPQTLTIQANQAPQEKIVVPPFCQGIFPIIAPIRSKFNLQTNGSCIVGVIFLNIPMTTAVWSVQTPGVPTTPTDFTVVTGGLAVNPWPGKHVTAGGFIYNPSGNTDTIFVDFVNTAQDASPGTLGTSVDLEPGNSIPIPTGYITVTVNCATPGVAFVAFGMGIIT